MKDNTVYLLYNTNASNIKLEKRPIKSENLDWEYIDKDSFTIMYSQEDVRKSTEIRIHSKTKLKERPKSAGEVMMQPRISAEGILIKKSISLSNIEDFFLRRRIPLIKPLFSITEIKKLQLLQEQCRMKHIGIKPDKSLQHFDIDDKDLRKYKGYDPELEEAKFKDKGKEETSPLLSTNIKSKEDDKRQGVKRLKGSDDRDKKIKTPASGKHTHEMKKNKKDLSLDKSKSGPEKKKTNKKGKESKNEKQQKSNKENLGTNKKEKQVKNKNKVEREKSPKDGQQSGKSKAKTSLERELKPTLSDETKGNPSKSKSKEKISREDMKHVGSDNDGTKGSGKNDSKQKLKSEPSEKSDLTGESSKHSKERTSQGQKSKKSDKSESGKSNKASDLSKKKKDKDVEEEDKLGASKTVPDQAPTKSAKGDKKTKQGTRSERKNSGSLTKEKPLKTDAEKKSLKSPLEKTVKFPNLGQHMIHYVLSNPVFVDLGWTLAPSDRAQLQAVTFRAVPSSPYTYCFRERIEDEIKYYSKNLDKVAFHFRKDGTGEIFYNSGIPAVTITKHNSGMRLMLYSDPKNDPLISDSFKSKVLAIFDSFGNGVVYDTQGKKLLNFNQLEGIYCSPDRKSPYKWQWCDYKILDNQRQKALLRYVAKEQKQPSSTKKSPPPSSGTPKKRKSEDKKLEVDEEYEQILAELPWPAPVKTKTKSENQFWGFKPITLKINNEMTLRINGQDDVSVNFSSNKIFLRIDLGVKIDPDVVERIEALAPTQVSDVLCVFDGLLDLSPSLKRINVGSIKENKKIKFS